MADLDPQARARVAASRVAHLATVRPDGRPHLVPVTFALVGDAVVSVVDDKPKTTTALARLANVRARPVASVLVDSYDDDWARLWWVRGDGAAEVVTSGPRHRAAIDHLSAKYAPYRASPPRGPVLVVDVERWVAWSASPLP